MTVVRAMVRAQTRAMSRAVVKGALQASGPITISANGQVISGKDITAAATAIDAGAYSDVTLIGSRITYNTGGGAGDAFGFKSLNADRVTIIDCEFINGGAPDRGAELSTNKSCVRIEGGSDFVASRITTRRGSNGLQLIGVNNTTIDHFESHDMRGPFPRGMAIQWVNCTGTHLAEDLSDESIPGTSNSEDHFSVYATPNVTMRRVKVPMGTDSTSGRGLVVEQAAAVDCLVEDFEMEWAFNGCAMVTLSADRVVYDGIKTRGWNRYGVRGWAGSSQKTPTGFPPLTFGVNPVTDDATTSITAEYYARGYTNSDTWNLKNIDAGVTQAITEANWTAAVSVVRNSFPWRNAALVPVLDLVPRINSYWLDGRVGTTLIAGTSVLGLLPGRYTNDPTSRTWQWRKNGVAISGATGINYATVVGDSGADIDCVETPINAAGSGTPAITAAVAIP